MSNKLHKPFPVMAALFVVAANLLASIEARTAETPSALQSDPKGWKDILPPANLKGWYRVPVPPTGQLGREQWHVDAKQKVLICDGDGGHDMLLFGKEVGDAVFHLEFCYTKVEGRTGYNSGAYVRNSKVAGYGIRRSSGMGRTASCSARPWVRTGRRSPLI